MLPKQQVIEWQEDIDYLKQELEQRHIHLYHSLNAEYFANELNKIKHKLPSLSETELMVDLMRLVKQVGDGHT